MVDQEVETVKTVLSASATLLGFQLVFLGIFVNAMKEKMEDWGTVNCRSKLMGAAWIAVALVSVATIGLSVWVISGEGGLYDPVIILFVTQLIAGTVLALFTAGVVILG